MRPTKNKVNLIPNKAEVKYWEYRDFLSNETGMKVLGEGGFAIVFELTKSNRVLKIGELNQDAYIEFVRQIGLNTKNKHLPKITKVEVWDSDNDDPYSSPYYTVEMERLLTKDQLVRRLSGRMDMMECYNLVDEYYRKLGIEQPQDFSDCNIDLVQPRTEDLKEVKNILKNLYDNGAAADLNDRNIMWRINSRTKEFNMVFTDPVV
jgi:hypothetical protein